ncbi:MAG: hypothetical protein KatS3mg002_1704 [Candidatus Woesearchaeota archaeon]|nr:MAG: hypothetical protein KatS3mg002_1698 [Candidatus Woesearchaeota archaeon]GIU70468.1 MAG: hypothetical protein KatS3mg002_1704 [Candidatus Woesearchaeota archaeon]GIX40432.1 MAG: hypothetical protein KatS3mg129_0165 [Leptospiraceae bacterium]GIX42588.1 MAG: hypothetical protein KatS3mg129_2321 [Leptospiraceae bacterium]
MKLIKIVLIILILFYLNCQSDRDYCEGEIDKSFCIETLKANLVDDVFRGSKLAYDLWLLDCLKKLVIKKDKCQKTPNIIRPAF